MMHKKIEIDLYAGDNEQIDLEDVKNDIASLLKNMTKNRNIAFEIEEKDNDFEKLAKEMHDWSRKFWFENDWTVNDRVDLTYRS